MSNIYVSLNDKILRKLSVYMVSQMGIAEPHLLISVPSFKDRQMLYQKLADLFTKEVVTYSRTIAFIHCRICFPPPPSSQWENNMFFFLMLAGVRTEDTQPLTPLASHCSPAPSALCGRGWYCILVFALQLFGSEGLPSPAQCRPQTWPPFGRQPSNTSDSHCLWDGLNPVQWRSLVPCLKRPLLIMPLHIDECVVWRVEKWT